jgi:F420 biosynthesis protein FbiB-like protein
MQSPSSAEAQHHFLRSRRSVRRFHKTAIPDEIIGRILETATWAPNAHNRQSWRFVHLKSPQSRVRLAEGMGAVFRETLQGEGLDEAQIQGQLVRSAARITQAPEAILLCMDSSDLDVYADAARSEGERLMAMQSTALAGGQLLLAAHAEGLGGVWVCAPLFAAAAVRTALELPPDWEAQGLLLLGEPENLPEPRLRKALTDVLVER